MKLITLSGLFLISISLASCQEKLSNETKKEIAKNKVFTQNKNNLIAKNKNSMEYPIRKDTTIGNEIRFNSVYIHSADCQFEFYVNDVMVMNFKGEMARTGGFNGDNMINPFLLTSGVHEVKVRMYPPFGKALLGGAAVGLMFARFKNGDLRTLIYDEKMRGQDGILLDHYDKQWVSEKGVWDTPSWVEGHSEPKKPEPFVGLPAYEWRSTFEAQVPFDLVGWLNSVNIKKEQDDEKKNIKAELITEYKKIYEIIKNKDLNGYLNLIREREELLEKTMYYSEKNKQEKRKSAEDLLNNNDFELEPLFEETFQLEYQGYGKLATLVHLADGEGIIRLKHKQNEGESIYLDFLFQRKIKGGKLSVI